jgi:hypothetical protein
MHRRLRAVPVVLALLGTALVGARTARAQMTEGERKGAARAAYLEGVELQDKGKPAEALARFEAAQKVFDAPTHLLRIGECQELTGRLVEASETYETLIRKTLPPGSPEPFVQAQEQGKTKLEKLRPRIPTMRVTVKPEPQALANLQITLNDRQLPVELVGIARPVNPGSYQLSAAASGWRTAAPVTVDVQEKEQKSIELVLQQSAGGAVAVAPPPPYGAPAAPVAAAPPPYAQPKPRPAAAGPSSTGLLLGGRVGAWGPGGNVDGARTFNEYASAGPGFGIDVVGRFAKVVLLGGTFEWASLGAPDASAFPTRTEVELSTKTTYFGLLVGIMPNVDKVTFVGDIGLGRRSMSRDVTAKNRDTGASLTSAESYSGFELAFNAGISIPAGPIRIVPKAGLAFGTFSDHDCGRGTQQMGLPGCGIGSSVDNAGHTIFTVALGLYYHVDIAKKPTPAPAAASPRVETRRIADGSRPLR